MFRKIFLIVSFFAVFSMSMAQAAEKQKITVASDCSWPPMEFLSDQKAPMGYSVDLLMELGKVMNVDFVIRNIAWDGIFSGVAAGKYDMVSSSVTITPERQKAYLFSNPYYDVTQAVVMPKDKHIVSLSDLKGKRVGGQIGTTGIFVMEKAGTGAVIREYDDVGLAMEDLKSGRIDAVICDSNVATYYANMKEGYKNQYHVAFKTKEVEHLGFCLQKGNTKLQKLLNDGLDKLRANGKLAELAKKWMGE